jgi:hypothetical protein
MLNRVQLGVVAYYLAFTIKGVVWIHFNGGFEAHNVPLLLAHTMWEGTVILGCAFLLTRAIDGLFGDRQAGNETNPAQFAPVFRPFRTADSDEWITKEEQTFVEKV